MTDDEVRVLAQLLLPYRRRVEAMWRSGVASPATTTRAMNLLTPAQAAARIGVSRTHVYDLIAVGKLRRFNASAKLGSTKLRVADVDVDAFIAAAEVPIAPPKGAQRGRRSPDRPGPTDTSPPTG